MKYIGTNAPNNKFKIINLILVIISIICIALSFFIYLYIIPVYIIGIIICYLLRNKSKLFYLNIIIYIICIILAIILFIFKDKSVNNLVGIWYCKYFDSDKYIVELDVNKDNIFMWSKYNERENNYIIGNYKLKKLDKKDDNKNVYYYNLVLDSDNYIENNIKKDKYYQKYDIAINIEEEKMILVNKENIKLICDKISSDNPIIDN